MLSDSESGALPQTMRLAATLAYWVSVAHILAAFTPSAWAGSGELAAGSDRPSIMTLAPDLVPVSDYSGNILERSTLFGDPGGMRRRLYEKGVVQSGESRANHSGVVGMRLQTYF